MKQMISPKLSIAELTRTLRVISLKENGGPMKFLWRG